MHEEAAVDDRRIVENCPYSIDFSLLMLAVQETTCHIITLQVVPLIIGAHQDANLSLSFSRGLLRLPWNPEYNSRNWPAGLGIQESSRRT